MAGTVTPLSMLLLPGLWGSLSFEVLRDVFGSAIESVLKQLENEIRGAPTGARLDIALAVPYLQKYRDSPRAALYVKVQKLIANVYKLICILAARNRIDVDDAEGIDVRILLLAHSKPSSKDQLMSNASSTTARNHVDAVVDLKTLACSERPWQQIFSIDNDDGDGILHEFLTYYGTHHKVCKVGGNLSSTFDQGKEEDWFNGSIMRMRDHNSVAVGGTFDHIHIGHKHLLTMFAFLLAGSNAKAFCEKSLIIGVTGDELLKNKKYPEMLESWDDRQQSVVEFLRAIMDFRPLEQAQVVSVEILRNPGLNGHAIHIKMTPNIVLKCVKISDPFGPTITDRDITALVISGETRAGGKAVNEHRAGKDWPQVEIFEVQVLDAGEDSGVGEDDSSFQSKLSSTQIRQTIMERARVPSKV